MMYGFFEWQEVILDMEFCTGGTGMRVKVRVVPKASKNEVRAEQGFLKVYVTAPAVEGKANKAMIELLADFFRVRKRNIRIIKGDRSREKVIEIASDEYGCW